MIDTRLTGFVNGLFGMAPPDAFVELRCLDHTGDGAATPGPREFIPIRNRDWVIPQAQEYAAKWDVYWGVSPRFEEAGGRNSVHAVYALWADCDSPAALERLRAFRPPPNAVVYSGGENKAHAYWLLHPVVTPDDAEEANVRLAHALGADPACFEAARILRVPSTTNRKYTPHRSVTLKHFQPGHYGIGDVVGALPEVPIKRKARYEGPPRDVSGDALMQIPPPEYVEALTGEPVPAHGKIVCPWHPDTDPSLHVYDDIDRGWCCHSCKAGGSIIDWGARKYGLDPRGAEYWEIRRRLSIDLLNAVASEAA